MLSVFLLGLFHVFSIELGRFLAATSFLAGFGGAQLALEGELRAADTLWSQGAALPLGLASPAVKSPKVLRLRRPGRPGKVWR